MLNLKFESYKNGLRNNKISRNEEKFKIENKSFLNKRNLEKSENNDDEIINQNENDESNQEDDENRNEEEEIEEGEEDLHKMKRKIYKEKIILHNRKNKNFIKKNRRNTLKKPNEKERQIVSEVINKLGNNKG